MKEKTGMGGRSPTVELVSKRARRVVNETLQDVDEPSSVGKALALLDTFIGASPSLGVTEIARRAGVAKSTAFRLLAILEKHQFVERREQRYVLAPRLFELGNQVQFCRPRSLRDIAMPHLADLYVSTNATIHLAVLDGIEILYLEKLFGRAHVSCPSHVGSRLPAATTALGKALVAFNSEEILAKVLSSNLERRTPYSIVHPPRLREEMTRIRTDGYAIDREEFSLGLTCVAAAVVVDGRAIAAVSAGFPSSSPNQAAFTTAVRRVAANIANKCPRSPQSQQSARN